MDFQFTSELIYKQCSIRISSRINEAGISNRSIYKPEPKIIGKIKRCEIDENRNKYLIRDSVLESIKDKLNFKCNQDILWGTHEEIEENLILIFQCLMFDLISLSSPYRDSIKEILSAYVPYARYLGYYRILFEQKSPINGIEMCDLYNVDIYNAYDTIDSFTDVAINYLFKRCKSDFKQSYFKFVDKHESFSRWIYRLEEWVNKDLMYILKEYKPKENSLGKRITKLIAFDYSYIPYLGNSEYSDKLKKIISATETYISELEKIQEELFDFEEIVL